ncbi:aspartate aminotransferase family protein [Enhygromyxa salina]|uniref:Glutamate-1-semialdehyde 2,1-aminomutase 1 n=1 Tax=Enhygromyxa salina TaxID=215803 RepID=A0A2S9YTV5_9BACT|nr:aminotransferase class III-fold pyridoxal phosphate-dependent enzyme [Enhygromyxa salina]PRQ08469.1 Glutamate-1-semialdehyde 2,1-aminomutase 1 [Enhygromyxa salina]
MSDDPRQHRYLAALAERYTQRTRGSQLTREAAWPALADGRMSQGYFSTAPEPARERWRATKQLRHSIVATRSQGPLVWDIDGNEYIDFCLGFGVHLFGHRPAFIEDALRAQLERGLPIGFENPLTNRVAANIARLTGSERVGFCNTGAEAVMGALRLARAATGRDRIAVFAGAYHGGHDSVLPLGQTRGVSANQRADTLVLEYGDARSLAQIDAHADQLAAVLVEPVQASNPGLQPAEFLHELRELTSAHDIALIFDDVLLGFRIHAGGSQAHFDIRADIATFGKIVGGGLPIGVVAGSARYLDALDGGRWSAHDSSQPGGDKIWLAGTFSKNPMTMAAAHAVTEQLLAAGPELQLGLNDATARLCDRTNTWLRNHSLPVELVRCGSLFRLCAPPQLWPVMAELRMRGVFAFDGMVFFVSTAHSETQLQQFEAALQSSLLALRDGGFTT